MSEKDNNLEKILKDLELDDVLSSIKSNDTTESYYEKPLEPPKRSASQEIREKSYDEKPEKNKKPKSKKKKKAPSPKPKKDGKSKRLKTIPTKAKTAILLILCAVLAGFIIFSCVSYAKNAYLKPYEEKYKITYPKGIAEEFCDAYGKNQSTVGSIRFGDDDELYITDSQTGNLPCTEFGTEINSEQQFKSVNLNGSKDIESEYANSESFVKASQKVTIKDIYAKETVYQVVSAFYVNKSLLDDNGYVFPYNVYGDLTEDSFDEYEDRVHSRSLYYTGYDMNYNDSFLTVSTQSKVYKYCNFVILCKKTDEDFEKITNTTANEKIHYPQKWYDDNDKHNPYWLSSKWYPTVYTDKKHTIEEKLVL